MSKVKSYTSLSGNRTNHYDENGKKVGSSYKSSSGSSMTHYDADGDKVGKSYVNSYGKMTHYDKDGNRIGYSYIRPSGKVDHYDANHNKISSSNQSFFDAYMTDTDTFSASKQAPTPTRSASSEDYYSSLRQSILAIIIFTAIPVTLYELLILFCSSR